MNGVVFLNVAYVYGGDWPSQGAAGSFCTFTCYGLAKKSNNDIYLFANKNTNQKPGKILNRYYDLKNLDNLNIKLINNNSTFSSQTLFYLKTFNQLRKLVKENKVKAIITRKTGFLPYLYFLNKVYKVAVFFEPHNFYYDKERRGKPKKWKKELFQNLFLSKMNGIICQQNCLKRLYQEYLPEQNYCVARTGIKEIIRMKKPRNNNYIGYIGSIKERKKISDILYALAKIDDKDLKFLIIGGRNESDITNVLNLAEELGVRERVKITGWVSRKEVEKYLKLIKIGVVPLANTFFNRYLTSPMKIFNYFSHGIPVIGTDLPTVREIITEECGLFYEPNNIEDLVSAINELNSSKKIFNQYVNNVYNRAESLLWEKRGEKILNFIKSVMVC